MVPGFFHLLNSSVIYKSWTDKDTNDSVMSLIAKIEANEKYVSMECMFKGFDYAVITPEGENRIVARTEESAFLTKHLRAYGGNGEFEGHRVGRLMRRMTFSGKGYVDTPANPQSVILARNEGRQFTAASENNPLFLLTRNLAATKAPLATMSLVFA